MVKWYWCCTHARGCSCTASASRNRRWWAAVRGAAPRATSSRAPRASSAWCRQTAALKLPWLTSCALPCGRWWRTPVNFCRGFKMTGNLFCSRLSFVCVGPMRLNKTDSGIQDSKWMMCRLYFCIDSRSVTFIFFFNYRARFIEVEFPLN